MCQHWTVYAAHGWFVLRQDAYGETDLAAEDANVGRIREQAEALKIGAGALVDLRRSNGMWLLSLSGYQNRPRGSSRDIEKLLGLVAELLPGSYGILYESDDERVDPPGGNAFRVRVMARGRLTEREDPFLSPLVPTIDDP
jgi:hypothetical protein